MLTKRAARTRQGYHLDDVARSKRFQQSNLSRFLAAGGDRQVPQSQTIVLDDDDDDLQSSSPRSFAQARSAVRSSRQTNSSAESPSFSEDQLELRLGPAGFTTPPSGRPHITVSGRRQVTSVKGIPLTIDLTSPTPSNDDCVIITEHKAPQASKRKRGQSVPVGAKEPALTCPICMDVMKEETSTICGHIFCKTCIFWCYFRSKEMPNL